MKNLYILICFLSVSLLVSGCSSLQEQRQAMRDTSEQKLTLGTAQKEVKEGMTEAQIAKVLGSPNMVTRDRDGSETWIYDKVSTEYAYSKSGGAGTLILTYGGSEAGVTSRSQRTLTIILKFKDGRVREFTYNASSF